MEKGAITLVPVVRESTHEQGVLRNLLKMYCYEWSQYNQLEVDANGRYAFEEQASAYWTNEGYYAFLISVDEQWAGFVFFDTHDFIVHTDYDYSMAEFFVMHAYRHRGIGRYVATRLFERFGGAWEIGCHPNNLSSVRFWEQVIGDYTLGNYTLMLSCPELKYHDGTLGTVISFHADTQ
jgi:predicted acetyltransferase